MKQQLLGIGILFLSIFSSSAIFAENHTDSHSTAIEQRRVSLRDSILAQISGAQMPEKNLYIKSFGAKADGKTDCRSAFDNGDDNVAIKSGRDNDGWNAHSPSENIIIRNCHFKGLHAVVIGSEMSSGVRNVFVEDCDYAGYCKRGIFVKTNPDRGGFVENLFVKNCKFGNVEDLFYVTSRYAGEGLQNHHFSTIKNIFVDGLSCHQVSEAALVLQGTEAKPIENVVFNHVAVDKAKTGISFENVIGIHMGDCNIGEKVGTPTQITAKDKIFDQK